MSLFNVLEISAAGLQVEQTRLQVTANNLANVNTSAADGQVYQPLTVVVGTQPVVGTQGLLQQPRVMDVVPLQIAPRQVYEPGHPAANADGFIQLPAVDALSSMFDLMSIARGYEANLRVFDITRTLLQKTLELGVRAT